MPWVNPGLKNVHFLPHSALPALRLFPQVPVSRLTTFPQSHVTSHKAFPESVTPISLVATKYPTRSPPMSLTRDFFMDWIYQPSW
jgi:hypothetical protein